jgi:hypothetical protein
MSKSDCFDFINTELEMLKYLIPGFYTVAENMLITQYITSEIQWHRKIKIEFNDTTKAEDNKNINNFFFYKCIEFFIKRQKEIIESAIRFLENKLLWVNMRTDEIIYDSRSSNAPKKLVWCKNDTDLLELITALIESKSIDNIEKNLSRKDAIEHFSSFFGRPIKDAESKLSRATERKINISPFLTSLKEAFDKYACNKEEKLKEIRK